MLRSCKPLCLALLPWLLVACTPPKPVAYLETAQDRATQDDVRERWGSPAVSTPRGDGGAEWIYRVWDHEPGSRVTAPAGWCDEYRLDFDAAGVLRSWHRESTRHLGETMPDRCGRPMAASPR